MRALLVEILLGIGTNCELPFYSALDKWRTSFPRHRMEWSRHLLFD